MKLILFLTILNAIYGLGYGAKNLFCYYDSSSFLREGLGKFLNPDLETAVQFCTHLVYGYLGIKEGIYQAISLNEDLDIHKNHFREVTLLKSKYPNLKILLSLGGDKDVQPENGNKYLELLEGEKLRQTGFISTAHALVKNYGFDGLDLAFQFPKNKPRKVHSDIGKFWKKFKKLFTGDYIVDEKAQEHKEQFTTLVRDLRNELRQDGLMLTVTVLPNVNSSWYFDVPVISSMVDYVNLAAFDFLTPLRNPDEADYTAPLFELTEQNRLPHYNVEAQVSFWLDHQCPPEKIIVGMSTYGRAWKLTPDSGVGGTPVVPGTDGPAPAGSQTHTPGLLSWPEICAKLPNEKNKYLKGADAPVRRIGDPTKRHGIYAFRPADSNGDHGIWISYDDLETAANKAFYVTTKNLGGLALFDLSYDDFSGQCIGEKYPILRAAKHRLGY